jgi:hypothetical protein
MISCPDVPPSGRFACYPEPVRSCFAAWCGCGYILDIDTFDQIGVDANPDAVGSIQMIGVAAIDPRQDLVMNQLAQESSKQSMQAKASSWTATRYQRPSQLPGNPGTTDRIRPR